MLLLTCELTLDTVVLCVEMMILETDNHEEDFSPEDLPVVMEEKIRRLTLEEHMNADKAKPACDMGEGSKQIQKKKKLKKKKVLKMLLGLDK